MLDSVFRICRAGLSPTVGFILKKAPLVKGECHEVARGFLTVLLYYSILIKRNILIWGQTVCRLPFCFYYGIKIILSTVNL